MSCPIRVYPLRKPENHRPPIPRWRLILPHGTSHVYTTYMGLQQRSGSPEALNAEIQARQAFEEWLGTSDGPSAYETFTLIDGGDADNSLVWACYWIDAAKHSKSMETLNLLSIYSQLPVLGQSSIGLWHESFATELSRLETNYSGLDYLPGMARIPRTSTEEHSLSAYWGAARDRIPDSAHDLFPVAAAMTYPHQVPTGLGQHLLGTNYNNLVHIRSGQFWENCSQQEADSYEQKLEPTLRAGLNYLCENSEETGAIGLRYLRNEQPSEHLSGRERKETCGAGFFTCLESMEKWAKSHRSHLKIYRGALTHYKTFGESRKFRTWHEVSVIKEGDARFEYINCTPKTGVMSSITLVDQNSFAEL
ncbi:heme-containing dehydratase protein [Pyrenochaeta sp. MPI-SDFR-AT-0127]|nr:heme-containing dehydratase protein [Pyrenochaeta sp. MPI-SDFR-AT-0127]